MFEDWINSVRHVRSMLRKSPKEEKELTVSVGTPGDDEPDRLVSFSLISTTLTIIPVRLVPLHLHLIVPDWLTSSFSSLVDHRNRIPQP